MNAALPMPENFGQTRTLFVTAGTPAAILVTPAGATHRQRTIRFKQALLLAIDAVDLIIANRTDARTARIDNRSIPANAHQK